MFILFILSWLGMIFLSVIVFESIHQAIKLRLPVVLSKHICCSCWWFFLALLTFCSFRLAALLNFLLMLPFALSHMNICRFRNEIIPLMRVLRNIPHAVSDFVERLKPYVK